MNRIDLCGEWIGQGDNKTTFIGTVPGCVHTDLFDTQKLFFNQNSNESRFIENENWTYTKKFYVEQLHGRATLIFQGLDTYCEIYLNNIKIGFADNMFIPHSYNVDNVLKKGENILEVRFFSPIKFVAGKEPLPGAFTTERLYTRRMQCTYGWDWVDRFVTCGIFKPVYIEFFDEMCVNNVYICTDSVDCCGAQISICESFLNYKDGGNISTKIFDEYGKLIARKDFFCDCETYKLIFNIPEPKLWYPSGYGEQPLYTLKISVGECEFAQKFGIRTVRILEQQDRKGSKNFKLCKQLQNTKSGEEYDFNTAYSGFIPVINGTKIFCTGANWVPCEPFPSAETPQKITKILEKAKAAGINMIRVWGGGLFETEHFYNECDRLGLLVTQDFLMACGKYPEDDSDFLAQLKKEAEFAAIYLRNHPSLIWWTGDNENAVRGNDAKKQYRGRIASHHAIAPIMQRLDYNRPFLCSSPYGGNLYASKTCGTTHNTQFLDDMIRYILQKDLSDYKEHWKEYTARFIAEEPILGAVCCDSLKKFISDDLIQDRSLWLYHTKSNPGLKIELLEMAEIFAEKIFGEFTDFDDKYFKLRYLQYEWVRITLENARRNFGFCGGIVYWMLNDCWPSAVGWSLIDYYNNPKSGYYALKHMRGQVCGSFDKENNTIYLYTSNTVPFKTECLAEVVYIDISTMNRRKIYSGRFSVGQNSKRIKICESLPDNAVLIADIKANNTYTRNFYVNGSICLQKEKNFNIKFKDGAVYISSKVYLHTVEISGAENVSDNYFQILPGETKKVSYTLQNEPPVITAYTLKSKQEENK